MTVNFQSFLYLLLKFSNRYRRVKDNFHNLIIKLTKNIYFSSLKILESLIAFQ